MIRPDDYIEAMGNRKKDKKPGNGYVNKGCYKGGVEFEGQWYRTKLDLWKAKGRVPLGTFKSRLHRGRDLRVALGIPLRD